MVAMDDRVGHDFMNGEANMFHSNFPKLQLRAISSAALSGQSALTRFESNI
jgi:hypothetical protein